jgi:hypothetical protein
MDLHVEMQGEEIVVTKPGTDFLLAYRKRTDSPNLVAGKSLLSRRRRAASFGLTNFRPQSPKRASSGGLCEPCQPR